jgi:lactate dehydrogenase-like 2-hydroxyacid dehydrogenase
MNEPSSPDLSGKTIGIVGLGLMGAPMAPRFGSGTEAPGKPTPWRAKSMA